MSTEDRPYLDLSAQAQRQYVDAVAALRARQQANAAVQAVRGGMYWKHQGPYEYLLRTAPDNRQTVLGPRKLETEALYVAFASRKAEATQRLASLTQEVARHERRNRVEQVGRAPYSPYSFSLRTTVGWLMPSTLAIS